MVKFQFPRANNLVINKFSKKSLSQGSSSLSDSLQHVKAIEDRSEPLSIAKIASIPCWEFIVPTTFSRTHWSWLCFAYFICSKMIQINRVTQFYKFWEFETELNQKIREIWHFYPNHRRFISKEFIIDPFVAKELILTCQRINLYLGCKIVLLHLS